MSPPADDADADAEPVDSSVPEPSLFDVPAPLTGAPRVPWDASADAEQGVAPEPAPDPTPFPEPQPEPSPEPTPFPEPIAAPAPSESTPTAFETVTDSTFTSEPEPAVASATEPSSPPAPGAVASITAEHPEYIIAAALIGGFILAKVVKKLAV